jgi:prepilin-type N-terminal cleavage/methylation domain-containing protein
MSMPLKKQQTGFTIVEFLISITVFSITLLIAASAIVYIGRLYYKGGIMTRTQESSQQLIEDVAQAVQFGDAAGAGSLVQFFDTGTLRVYCIGSTRYTYRLGVPLTTGNIGVWKDINPNIGGTCVAATGSEPSGKELLSNNMRISRFDITSSNNAHRIDVRVSFGATDDLFTDATFESCVSVATGGQFCAVSRNSTTVVNRLR